MALTDLNQLAKSDVRRTLMEDLGISNEDDLPIDKWIERDITSRLVDPTQTATATILTREETVLCGIPWLQSAMSFFDSNVRITLPFSEGQYCPPNQIIAVIKGNTRSILVAERTALNFLQLLSGVATHTRRYVKAVQHTKAKILDTRKTLPTLRSAQRYAVSIGGGENQRSGLYDAILIKENHISSYKETIKKIITSALSTKCFSEARWVQVEVETLEQMTQALELGVPMILLDNMDLLTTREAVRLNAQYKKPALLEASGGVDLEQVRAIAETGVDRISIGRLTKDIQSIDFSLRIESNFSE